MKKSIFAFFMLILIVGAWFVSGFWVFETANSNEAITTQEPDAQPEPTPEPAREPEDEPDVSPEEEYEPEEPPEEDIINKRNAVLEESRLLFRGYFYEEAIELLNEDESLINHETQALEEEIVQAKNSLVRFEGEIKHIFFHSLILYPEKLFPDLSVPTGGYNEGFIYQSELFRILPQLLERGYVLYSINDIFSQNANGNMQKNDIYLPPGKRPLVLSIDDLTYHYNRTTPSRLGFANRIVFDEYGEIATEVPTPEGTIETTYDGDVHVVVDQFVRENPEFSFRGNKGVLAVTGYMGIFGYDLDDLRNPDYRQRVIDLCDKFKENGWLFANHSYTHNRTGFWGPESNPANINNDVRRWRDTIEPLVGETNIFIAPFGYLLRGEGMQIILDNGYNIYCTVDINQPINIYNTHVVMGRIEIGGYGLGKWVNTLNRDFFDVASVIDPYRPPILSN